MRLNQELVAQWHPTQNGDLKPEDVTAGSNNKVHWKCYNGTWPDGTFADDHEWESALNNRSRGSGCSRCNESKGEKQIATVLEEMGLSFEREARFGTCKKKRMLPFDFFVELLNKERLLIEFHGKQHYEPVYWCNSMSNQKAKLILKGVQKRDEIKEQWAKDQGIELLVIPHWDKDNIPSLVREAAAHSAGTDFAMAQEEYEEH